MTPGRLRRPLLVVGAGGMAREALEAAAAAGCWQVLGVLDDDPTRHGALVGGAPVLGPVEAAHDHPEAAVVVCTGRPDDYGSRERIVARLRLPPDRWATVVHPAAALAGSCRLGEGCVVLAGVVATADVTVGRHVVVMPHVTLTHDDVVGDFATLAAGVRLAGGVRVGAGAYLGAGALVREGRRIGPGALVGMGAVVVHDVPAGEVWAGVPARRLRPVG